MVGRMVWLAAVVACVASVLAVLAQAQAQAQTPAPVPNAGCEHKAATACLPGVPEAMARKLARNAPALRTLLSWLAVNEAYYGADESPTTATAARRDEVLREYWAQQVGGALEPGPLSLTRLEQLLADVVSDQKRHNGNEPWLLVCRAGTSWPLARTQSHATRPCVSLQMEPAGRLVLAFGDFAQQREPWAPGPAPWLATPDFQVVMALADGRTLSAGKPHQAPAADLAYESEDWGVPETKSLRAADVHAPTPATIPGARVIGTAALFKMVVSDTPPLIIDVIPAKWRFTVPGAFQLPNAGVLATEGKYGDRASAINATLRTRLAAVLEQETGGDRNKPVVFLCLGVDCWLSYNAALRAVGEGYTNVLWYRGGTAAWRDAGAPWQLPQRIQFKDGPQDWEEG